MTNLDPANNSVPPANGGGGLKPINAEISQPATAAEADAPGEPDEAPRIDPNNRANKVEEFFPGRHDSGGRHIDMVYFKRDDYAIYRSGAQVLVVYSDEKATADKQIAAVSALLPLRDHLANLIRDLPEGGAKNNYFAQMADALRLGLEGQTDTAKTIIEEAMRDGLEVQARIGRLVYLKCAALGALLVAAVLIPIAIMIRRADIRFLVVATGAGAVGAMLSIAIAIRSRAVAIDGNWQANAADAAIRVGMGIISAALLYLLLSSGALDHVQVGSINFAKPDNWKIVVLIGFAGGFLERLVPDLLEKGTGVAKPPTPPTSSGGVASPGATKT